MAYNSRGGSGRFAQDAYKRGRIIARSEDGTSIGGEVVSSERTTAQGYPEYLLLLMMLLIKM